MTTAENKTLENLFHDHLKDIYFAENAIVKDLPKMAKAAQSEKLVAAFEKHLEETQEQIARLEKVFKIFGKPADREDAAAMLASLSGSSHEVLTAVALKGDDFLESVVSRSEVKFKKLTPAEIAAYVESGECDDKAGAYAIQGRAARFVVELRGSYSGVMGLPLYETSQLLEKMRGRNPH